MAGFAYNDGGREQSGFRGDADDCVVRAYVIASGLSYTETYAEFNDWLRARYPATFTSKKRSVRNGVQKADTRAWFEEKGWTWTPTMRVGQGTKVHLRADELPSGPIVCSVSRHLVAVLDGVVHDTHDPRRGGKRAVYGYWTPPGGST